MWEMGTEFLLNSVVPSIGCVYLSLQSDRCIWVPWRAPYIIAKWVATSLSLRDIALACILFKHSSLSVQSPLFKIHLFKIDCSKFRLEQWHQLVLEQPLIYPQIIRQLLHQLILVPESRRVSTCRVLTVQVGSAQCVAAMHSKAHPMSRLVWTCWQSHGYRLYYSVDLFRLELLVDWTLFSGYGIVSSSHVDVFPAIAHAKEFFQVEFDLLQVFFLLLLFRVWRSTLAGSTTTLRLALDSL